MELGRNLIFRVENNSTWGEGRSKDSTQSSSRKQEKKRVEFAQRALFVSAVFFLGGMFMSDQRWSSCYTLSDGKHNNNNNDNCTSGLIYGHARSNDTPNKPVVTD